MPLPGSVLHGAGEVGWLAIVCSDLVIGITISEVGWTKKVLGFCSLKRFGNSE